MTKLKLLSLTNYLLDYRVPVYNLLSDNYDLTVAHYGKSIDHNEIKFKEILLTPINVGPLIFFKENIAKLASGFDAVIALGELRIIPFLRLGFLGERKFSLTYWNIGVSASYKKKFDEDRSLDLVRFKSLDRADSIVFYTDYPVNRYVNDGGVSREKLFVANNTVAVYEKISIKKNKNYFLFVGTLYRAKKIFDLLESYSLAYESINSIRNLLIVGDGSERNNIAEWIHKHNLSHKIFLKGAEFNPLKLTEYYRNAIALISPGQAGLTVLNSFAHGVPFITTKTAITGGEIFNISDGINGILYEDSEENLKNIILNFSSNSQKSYKMGVNAQNYYYENRTIKQMVDGLIRAINYGYNNKK